MSSIKKPLKKILAVRFSAFGDVLLTYPVLKSVCELNPNVEIIFLTQNNLVGFFKDIPGLKVIGADLKGEHKGILGLYRLAQKIKKEYDIDYVCDLHQVTRTHLLNFLLNKKTFKIDKGRKEKRMFIKHKIFDNLKHSTERYMDVFKSCGLMTAESIKGLGEIKFEKKVLSEKLNSVFEVQDKDVFKLGFAPFAKHATKTWPMEHLEKFLSLNQQSAKMKIYMFGGRGEESLKLEALEKKYSLVRNLAGKFSFEEEISLIQKMNLMVVMDSANMHLAGLSGTPIISIWGGTHPGVGFYPISNRAEILQIDRKDLNCRPCSVFGRSDCPKTHFKCMLDIKPEQLIEKVSSLL